VKEFYENLKKKRNEKGISLEEIHQKSRLSLDYLIAIEAGRIEKLPAGYERIYLKRYAKEIGLDEAEVLRDFDLMTGRLKQPETASAKEVPSSPKAKKEPKEEKEETHISTPQISTPDIRDKVDNLNLDRIHKIFWIGLAVVILAVAAYFTYQQYVVQQESRNLAIKEITISELLESTAPEKEQPSFTDADSPTTTNIPSNLIPQLLLELRALERTWIREIVDSRDTTDYILPAGLSHSSQAVQQFQLLLGRADGVEIWLNGNNMGIMGQAGEIAYVVLNSDGVALKRVRKVSGQPGERANSDTTVTEEAVPDTL
jgi:cytoskeletal protein RodZ